MGKKIHFVGCEGVSMKMLKSLAEKAGNAVSGSDLALSGHDAKNVEGADLVVYTAAIPWDNPELARARELGIQLMTRGEFLGETCAGYAYSVAVAGTHGKTTTTAMLWEALTPLDPTIHIGGSYNGKIGRAGGDKIFVTEACEYKRSFLSIKPDIAIILNVDLDHTDCYKTLGEMQDSFARFAAGAKRLVIVNGDEFPSTEGVARRIMTVGFNKNCDYRATCLSPDKLGRYSFCVYHENRRLGRVTLSVAGRHNVYNALFTIAACGEIGQSFGKTAAGLSRFTGAQRRMELIGHREGCAVFSDYAHHPKEIAMGILCARECKYSHIIAVFEPHTYTRTASFFAEFAEALSKADEVVLLPIYAARENPAEGIDSAIIAKALKERGKEAVNLNDYEQAKAYLAENLKDDGVILFMGAGTIDTLAREFAK